MRHGARADDDPSWKAKQIAKGGDPRLYDTPLANYKCVLDTATYFKDTKDPAIDIGKIGKIVSSPFRRCFQTALTIAHMHDLTTVYVNNNLGESYSALAKYLTPTGSDYVDKVNDTFSLLQQTDFIQIIKEYKTNSRVPSLKHTINVVINNVGSINWSKPTEDDFIKKTYEQNPVPRLKDAIKEETKLHSGPGNLLIVTHGDFTQAVLTDAKLTELGGSPQYQADYCGFVYFGSDKMLRCGTNIKDSHSTITPTPLAAPGTEIPGADQDIFKLEVTTSAGGSRPSKKSRSKKTKLSKRRSRRANVK